MQPFESWPLKRSTKKTYSEVTACELYTVTKNCFHLLDNNQENNSPVDVLNKSSQPVKYYSSANRVRSAHVKSELQTMKISVKLISAMQISTARTCKITSLSQL